MKQTITILAFGNEYIEMDSAAKKVAAELIQKKFKVVMCDSPEEIMMHRPPLVILDVAPGISRPTLLTIEQLQNSKLYSLHDFDLGYFLKLMKEMNEIDEEGITIIALPANRKTSIKEIEKLLPINPQKMG